MTGVRFNDQLQTVLAASAEGDFAAITLWRQCVDLLAQHDRPGSALLDRAGRDALMQRLTAIRARVPETQRIATVIELGSRLRSPTLIRFFAADRPAIAAAAMARASLPDLVWPAIIPALGPTARGVLRGRRDMGAETVRALAAYGATDLVIDGERAGEAESLPELLLVEAAPADEGEAEERPTLAALVDRIKSFTEARRERESREAAEGELAFEADVDGVIKAGNGALIGLSIADAGGSSDAGGPDGQAAGAFRRRDAIRNARFSIGAGALAGEWRMGAAPLFDQPTGRFLGYSGTLRRPHLHEVPAPPPVAAPAQPQIFGPDMPADSVRQLVHELRTPLNAILGFAEIIEQQMFGPAAARYRVLAADIIADARRLLGAFDDLDLASRMERGDADARPESVDTAALVASMAARFRVAGHALDIRVGPEVPHVRLDPVQAERMIQHLLRSLVALAAPGELLHGACLYTADMRGGAGHVIVSIERPSALKGLEEQTLLDPGYGPAGESPDAPLLGLGFSLRLVRSIAESAGGRLTVDPDRFLLRLPAAEDAPGQVERG